MNSALPLSIFRFPLFQDVPVPFGRLDVGFFLYQGVPKGLNGRKTLSAAHFPDFASIHSGPFP